MNRNSVYCEECVEDIPNDEIYWEETRMYCGRCGSEMDVSQLDGDVFNTITTEKPDFHNSTADDDFSDVDDEEPGYREVDKEDDRNG